MPTQKAHSRAYSLKDLILVGSVIKFALGVTAAIFMHRWNNNSERHRHLVGNCGSRSGPRVPVSSECVGILVLYYVLTLDLPRGSVANWVENRKQEEQLREMLEERDALWATNSTGNASLAELAITAPIGFVAAGNGQDGQADIYNSVNALDIPATTATNMNTLSSTLIPSTCSSKSLPALDESLPFSQVEKSGRNEESIRNTGRNDVKRKTQQLTPTLTLRNITRNVALSGTDPRSSMFPPVPSVSVLVEAEGTNEDRLILVETTGQFG